MKNMENVKNIEKDFLLDEEIKPNLAWQSSPTVQKLLDVICQIIANDYSRIAKENPETFSKG